MKKTRASIDRPIPAARQQGTTSKAMKTNTASAATAP
eukprot:CAMPEP_0184725132 /NCGR_PEP_ID=MMETSP0314-20130426/29960_1 /TAXON_ID=38298 /ORGANISM="Rhodella maculata, Strain CCMP 736" /LENGTH=36 /DNA_ID= /DNA_START= /DNA_END= /DNA_ORIENTATION=